MGMRIKKNELIKIMLDKGLSQKKLAERANLTDTAISNILSKQTDVRIETAKKILDALDIKDYDILFYSV